MSPSSADPCAVPEGGEMRTRCLAVRAVLGQLPRRHQLGDGQQLQARTADPAQSRAPVPAHHRGAGHRRRHVLRPAAADHAADHRQPVPGHPDRGVRDGRQPGAIDHRIDPRAVRGHAPRAGRGPVAPHPRAHPRSVRRAGLVVQLDGRQHRGTARAEGGQGAPAAGTADRARHPDLAAAIGDAAPR